jgi:hypothetical protein
VRFDQDEISAEELGRAPGHREQAAAQLPRLRAGVGSPLDSLGGALGGVGGVVSGIVSGVASIANSVPSIASTFGANKEQKVQDALQQQALAAQVETARAQSDAWVETVKSAAPWVGGSLLLVAAGYALSRGLAA